ncbi:MAG TPA: phage terminase large subunit, partial [Bacillota bacterium]|nr:phage terminase large subunit [Bacillota bacterium]
RFIVVRKVKETLRDSVFAELVNCITRWEMRELWKIPKGRNSELYLKCLNGSEILFFGLDDVEKLKSIQGITGIWVEEASELEPGDYKQLDIRLRGKTKFYKQMIITFNPIYKGHWLEG